MMNVNELQELICEAVELHDYELSIDKNAGEQITENLKTAEGCHLIIEMLLNFLEVE